MSLASDSQAVPRSESRPSTASTSQSTHTTVLDPFAFLTELAKPLLAARDACVRFVAGTAPVPRDATPGAQTESDEDTSTRIEREARVIERSFASEFAALHAESTPQLQHTHVSETTDAPATSMACNAGVLSNEDAPDAVPKPAPEGNAANRIVLRSSSPLVERAVPLTRLPLRPQENEITWTRDIVLDSGDSPSRAQRHAFLERCVRDASILAGPVLEKAYRQEDLAGRTIALRALSRQFPAEGREVFVEALRIGSDDERAIAIDGLTGIGARAELVSAFGDRIDAVAAKAALAYVGSRSRADYRTELAPHVDAAQIDRILTLLAGVIE